MHKKSVNFTPPNDDWLKAQVQSKEYGSISDVVNDLVRKERMRQDEIEFIRAKLIAAEQSGFSTLSRDEHLAQIKERARRDGKL